MDHNRTEIQKFYSNSTVFLTGASGFLGKLLIEKLLRTCPDIKKIYVLLRTKKDKEPKKRLEEMLAKPLFEKLKQQNANVLVKLGIIGGDLTRPNLGINETDLDVLRNEVEIIFHVGATVRFEENLKTAADINLRAVRDLVRIAKNVKRLKSFVHVSTAFSHSNREVIEEKFYDVPISGEKLLNVMDSVDAKLAEAMTPALLHDWRNTYVFTKALAEDTVKIEGKGLPIGVYRPSIILGCYKEPLPGWIDNVYGPTGVVLGTAMGILRVFQCDVNKGAEMVPADYVVNSLIATAWDINRQFENERTSSKNQEDEKLNYNLVPIYNFVSCVQKKITWNDFITLTEKHGKKIPSPLVLWHYVLFITMNPILHKLGIIFLHHLPAYTLDFLAKCIGRKPYVVKTYERIHKFCGIARYFIVNEWSWSDRNTRSVWERLSPEDQHLFDFDMKNFNWDDYFRCYCIGVRVFLLKDPMSSVPAGKRKVLILRAAHYVLVTLILLVVYQILNTVHSLALSLLN